jgi:universal stress protein E
MTKILVVIDPREETHSALERCKEISPEADLQLHVCMFVDADSAQELANTLKERTQWLDEQVKPYIDLGYDITKEVTSFARLYESVIQIALKVEADLIFKPMRQHSIVRRVVLTSTDWNLIRFCPTPVLLVSDQEVVRGKPVVAAIDVCNAEEKHAELNHIVLGQATTVAEVLESKVHCVNAWNVSSAVMAAGSIDPTPYEIAHAKKNDHLQESKSLCQKYDIPADRIIVEEGTPEFVINTAAEELDAGVLVIGTVARSGISGLFIGNTAEAVLEGSAIDIMVVKQPDFECPLDL